MILAASDVSAMTAAIDLGAQNHLMAAIKAAASGSASMVTTALAIVAGSIATIVSTSNMQPRGPMRWFYLLFIPGWLLIAASMYEGDVIARRAIAAHFVDPKKPNALANLHEIADRISPDYSCQRIYLALGLAVFAVWLISFLIWWVFGTVEAPKKEN